jgi:hypothetical protein
MKARFLGMYAVLACSLASIGGSARAEDNTINWMTDYGEALRQARQTRKPVFLEFRCEA